MITHAIIEALSNVHTDLRRDRHSRDAIQLANFLNAWSGTWPAGVPAGFIALSALALCLVGCAQLGPDLVKAGRNDYNIILQQTEDEEAILNLVRVRYGDRPLFLDVSNVSTSFTWTQGSSVQGTLSMRSSGRRPA